MFEKQWALSVLELVFARLRAEFAASEKAELFDALKPALSGEKLDRPYAEEKLDRPYAEVGAAFDLSEGAVKVAVHRMRKRFGELLRAEVAETVQDEAQVEDELRDLLKALSS
jgi:hypothetical protein